MIEMYTSATGFRFVRGTVEVGTMPFETLKPVVNKKATDDDKIYIKVYAEDFLPGETIKIGKQDIILGPTREFTHEVFLRAAGNPDFRQYADIGPKKTVRCCGVEEAVELVLKYQDTYEMGGGNCSKEHGVVWQLPQGGKGRRKSIGRVSYNGKFSTNAEIAAQEAEFKAKYGK